MKSRKCILRDMKKINILPNLITSFGLACGLFVIFRVNMRGIGTYEMLHSMTLILLLAALADVLDGALARALRVESEFGLNFDSLADAISFGVAPAVLFLKSLCVGYQSPLSMIAIAGAMIYTICGVYRLVRYNVTHTKQRDDQAKAHFIGLPIPAAAVATIAPNLLISSPFMENIFTLSTEVKTISLSIWMVIIGYFMVSHIYFPSIKSLQFRVPQFNYVLFASVFTVLIIYGLLYFLPVLLIIFSWSYLILGISLTSYRYFKKQRK